jgi:hypothetical protein
VQRPDGNRDSIPFTAGRSIFRWLTAAATVADGSLSPSTSSAGPVSLSLKLGLPRPAHHAARAARMELENDQPVGSPPANGREGVSLFARDCSQLVTKPQPIPGNRMKATTRFFKMSFLIGAHAVAAAWGFWALKLFIDGNFGWAFVFAMLAGVNAVALSIWWSNRLPRDEGVRKGPVPAERL